MSYETDLKNAYDARKSGDSAKALEIVNLALGAAKADRSKIYGQLLCAAGQFQRDLGNLAAASDAYSEAVEFFQHDQDHPQQAHAMRHQGDIERELHNLDVAEKLLKDALKIYENEKGASELCFANAQRSFALVQEARGEIDDAKPYWQAARKVYAKLAIKDGVAECDSRLKK